MGGSGLTYEDRRRLTAHNIEKLNIPLKELDPDSLRREVEAFLKRKQCLSLATVSPAGNPHQTILDYVSDGLTLYIASEGGTKFRNLEASSSVSISIGFSDGTVASEYGLIMDGEAKVYSAPHPKYLKGILKLKPFVEQWAKSIQPLENILKTAINTRLIVMTPKRITYMNIPEGVPLSLWEGDA